MFFAKKYLLSSIGFFEGFVDYHSHILPNVDDGVATITDSLAILEQYEKLGIERVLLTPHIADCYPANNALSLRSVFDDLQSLYDGDVKLHLAAEYMLDSDFAKHLDSGDLLTLWDNYLLVETSYVAAPINFIETLHNIKSKGYNVVLAHPERYSYMDIDLYMKLRGMNITFQLDLLSLSGYYGDRARRRAEYLLDNEMYEIIGTDLHSLEQCEINIKNMKLTKKTIKKIKLWM